MTLSPRGPILPPSPTLTLHSSFTSDSPGWAYASSPVVYIHFKLTSTVSLAHLNHPIEEHEITKGICSLPLNKFPGIDGLSSEYYKPVVLVLRPYLVKLYNSAVSTEQFPKEMLWTQIVTLPKLGKEPTQPQNVRPIFLFNSDLKMFSKILANRLLNVTPLLLGSEQVGFVKDRQAPDGTRRMLNLIHYAEICQVPSLLLALDAEKAFNRVHWGYLSQVLSKFGFLGFIYSVIMSLYKLPCDFDKAHACETCSHSNRQACIPH